MEDTQTAPSGELKSTAQVAVPTVKELLEVGVQFGHESQRWNPKMSKYIYTSKNSIHIIDIHQTEQKLTDAVNFLADAASKGNVIFVGTKRQASDIVKEEAIRAGAYFISSRWAGGLLTNFNVVKKSLAKLDSLEKSFEEGIQGRTKYEVSVMKKEWERLNRLYEGIKSLNSKPTAVVIVDTRYEKAAVREARKIGVPVVALIDTNCDPDTADYIIPGNDDAIGSIRLILKTLADAVLAGNKGNGIKHNLVDYSKVEIKITKKEEDEAKEFEEVKGVEGQSNTSSPMVKEEKPKRTGRKTKVKGMLEIAKEKAAKAKKTEVKPKSSSTEKSTKKDSTTKTKKVAKKVTKKTASTTKAKKK